jgi:putative ABC transport system permease protein
VLALVVGVSVAVFSSVLLTTLDRGVESGAAAAVGAELRAEGPVFDEATMAAASTLPGVDAVSGVDLAGPAALRIDKVRETVQLFVVDSATLQAFRDLPAGLDEPDGEAIPVVLSSDIAERLEPGAELLLEGLPVAEAGVADRTSGYGATSAWVLIDRAFAEQLTGNHHLPRLLLVDTSAGADVAALATDLTELGGPTTRVTSLDQAIADARSAPTTAGLRSALLLAVVAISVLAALAVVLSSAIGAASRNRILGQLRTVGLSGRQASALVAWELGPPAAVAVLVGTVLGLALPWVVTGAVDLRPFTGGASQPDPAIDPLLIALVLGGVLLSVVAAAAIAIVLARRASPATTLRMGAD